MHWEIASLQQNDSLSTTEIVQYTLEKVRGPSCPLLSKTKNSDFTDRPITVTKITFEKFEL